MSNALDILELYSLEKTVALNKRSLAMQYEQCGQLGALRHEVAAANGISRELLRNQVRELERQERVRYYKTLIFNINEAADKLEGIDDEEFFYFACGIFIDSLAFLASECTKELEDLQDKTYAKEVCKRIDELNRRVSLLKSRCTSSIWMEYKQLKTTSAPQEIELAIKQNKQKITETEALIEKYEGELSNVLSFLMSSSKKGLYRQIIDESKESIYEYEDEVIRLTTSLNEHAQKYNNIYQDVTLARPGWEREIENIGNYLPKAPDSTRSIDEKPANELDSMFVEVAQWVVSSQQASTSAIQHKFAIGYHRAEQITRQLEMAGIIAPARGARSRDILIMDDQSLQTILEMMSVR